MADAGLNAVEKALVTRLTNYSGMSALVGTRIFAYLMPPNLDTYPAIVFSLADSAPEGRAFSGDAESYDFTVKAVDKGNDSMARAGDVAEVIDAALHNATLSPTGYTAIYAIKRQRWIRYPEPGPDRVTFWHAGAVYRMWAQRS